MWTWCLGGGVLFAGEEAGIGVDQSSAFGSETHAARENGWLGRLCAFHGHFPWRGEIVVTDSGEDGE